MVTPSRLSSWNSARISVGRAAVEGAGRLVGEQEARVVHERPRDGDALLLAARQLHGAMVGAVREADAAERLQGALAAGPAVEAGIDHRQFDIAQRVHARQQVELLEDEADLAVAQARQAVGIEALDRGARRGVLPAGRPVEAADEVHEGRLARARRTHDGDEIALVDVERHAVERDDASGIEIVDPSQIARFDERHGAFLEHARRARAARAGPCPHRSAADPARGAPTMTAAPSCRSPRRISV